MTLWVEGLVITSNMLHHYFIIDFPSGWVGSMYHANFDDALRFSYVVNFSFGTLYALRFKFKLVTNPVAYCVPLIIINYNYAKHRKHYR